MADDKPKYSKASSTFVQKTIHESKTDMDRYERSKERERKFNDTWMQNMVNLNDIVHLFAPNSEGKVHGVKFEFEGDRYIIKADMASGYLRIYDKILRAYVKLDGNPGSLSNTHFKIMKRSEM
ncbi:MAG: hypothetical protein J6Y08_02240 [Clostridiales bacterium]|nr:hypothetical protein [Clostridiales bacterium]